MGGRCKLLDGADCCENNSPAQLPAVNRTPNPKTSSSMVPSTNKSKTRTGGSMVEPLCTHTRNHVIIIPARQLVLRSRQPVRQNSSRHGKPRPSVHWMEACRWQQSKTSQKPVMRPACSGAAVGLPPALPILAHPFSPTLHAMLDSTPDGCLFWDSRGCGLWHQRRFSLWLRRPVRLHQSRGRTWCGRTRPCHWRWSRLHCLLHSSAAFWRIKLHGPQALQSWSTPSLIKTLHQIYIDILFG